MNQQSIKDHWFTISAVIETTNPCSNLQLCDYENEIEIRPGGETGDQKGLLARQKKFRTTTLKW